MDIIITGATGGLGRHLVQKAMDESLISQIYCIYRNQSKFDALFPVLSSKLLSVNQLHYKTPSKNLACVLTGFAINPLKNIGDFQESEVNENIQTNIQDTVILINSLVKLSSANNINLRLINIDSGAAYKPIKGWGMYCAAKSYINMFLKTLCIENQNVKAVTYEPGVMDTEMQSKIRMCDEKQFEWVEQFKTYHVQGQLNNPREVADDIFNRFVLQWDGKDFQVGYRRE